MTISTENHLSLSTIDGMPALAPEEIDILVHRAAGDMKFYRDGLDDVVDGKRYTEAAIGFVVLDSLRPFNES